MANTNKTELRLHDCEQKLIRCKNQSQEAFNAIALNKQHIEAMEMTHHRIQGVLLTISSGLVIIFIKDFLL